MVKVKQDEGALVFNVKVVPRAARSELVGEHGDALRIRIAAPPVDGAANSELLRTLAATFDVAERFVEIRSGHNSALKRVAISAVSPEKFLTAVPGAQFY